MSTTIWSGVIAFGLVSIPVKLYSATNSKRVSFHQLHAKCNTRIKEVRWCPTCDREVPWEEIVKGYSLSKDETIPVTEEDFEKLPIPSKNVIDITSFAPLDEVDPLYFEKNYFLLPEKKGQKAFRLFLTAIQTKSLVAVGKIAIRTRERLCAIRSLGDSLILCTLLYPDEIKVDIDEKGPVGKISRQELDMALNLIDMMRQPFDPASYKDDYREALNQLIGAKVSSKGAKKTKAPNQAGAIDLMEALKASVNSAVRNGKKGAVVSPKRTVRVKKAKMTAGKKTPARKVTRK